MDPDCNHFRDFLFDHPCGFVLKKGKCVAGASESASAVKCVWHATGNDDTLNF